MLEAALGNLIAVLAMGMATTLRTAGALAGLLALGTLLAAVFSLLIAVAAGLIWSRVLGRLADRHFTDLLAFGMALVLWDFAEVPGASGALLALAFGLTLANERALRAKWGTAGAQ